MLRLPISYVDELPIDAAKKLWAHRLHAYYAHNGGDPLSDVREQDKHMLVQRIEALW
jgi:hypothetical protein